ncbi:MAG TPA: DUF456 domain-containing protein [Actinomycetes bacterium]|nr:DUF456 domain-containing protein [Actinomycetes bacterium]
MDTGGLVLVGLVILLGLLGVVVPLLPGLPIVLGAIAVWAIVVGTPTAWTVLAGAAALIVAGSLVKYVVPARRLRAGGVPWASTAAATVLAIVGFFVIPVIGAVIGFVAGMYVAERLRLGSHELAWPSARAAVMAVGVSLLIELGAGLLAAGLWLAAVIMTA